MSVTTERPGVYSSYTLSGRVRGTGSGTVVGLAAVSAAEDLPDVAAVTSQEEAETVFGATSAMAALCRVLLLNGAPEVRCAAVDTGADAQDYAAAFALLALEEDVGLVVCDSQDTDVHAALQESIETAGENSKYRMGIVEVQGNAAALTAAAEDRNSERMVLVGPCTETAGAAAAAVCGALAGEADPALPLNGARLYGLGQLSWAVQESQVTGLIQDGVTLLERTGGAICVVRGVTTRTTTNGAADATWREITTVRIVDDVIPGIRQALRAQFSRSKNTLQTRGAIRTQVIVQLEDKLAREIIDGYDNVTVEADAEDPTVCRVQFDFTVAHGLNQIYLTAHITV